MSEELNEGDLINNILTDSEIPQLNINLEINDNSSQDKVNEQYDWSFNDIELNPSSFTRNTINAPVINEYDNDSHEEVNINDLYNYDEIKIIDNDCYFPRNCFNSSDDDSNCAEYSETDDETDSTSESDNESMSGSISTNYRLVNKITTNELNRDVSLFQNLVKNQTQTRISMLHRVLYSYFKQYIFKLVNTKPVLTKKLIDKIIEMGEILDLENKLGVVIAEILLDNKDLNGRLINKYSNILAPFITTHTSQENFLNSLLVIINNNHSLIKDYIIIDIFVSCITNRLIPKSVLKSWSKKLNEDNAQILAEELNIDVLLVNMVDSILNN